MPSVDCDQEDGDEAEAEAEDESEDVDEGDEDQDDGDGASNAGSEKAENGGQVVGVLVRGVASTGTHDVETRATGMNDDVVDDVAEEDSRGDAHEGGATDTTTTTKTTTTAFLVRTPTADIRPHRFRGGPGERDRASAIRVHVGCRSAS